MRAAIDRGVPIGELKRKSALAQRSRYASAPALPPPSAGSADMWQVRKPNRGGASPPSAEKLQEELEERRLVTVGDAGAFAKRDVHTDLKVELHQRLLDLINLQALDKMSRAQIEAEVGDIVAEELAKQNHALNQAERKQLVGDVLDELLGLGPLEPLLKDPTITDILVNGHARVFVERYGVLEPSPMRFKDEKHLLRIIQKIVSAVGRRIDESSPMVDARLADGSRVNAVVPPLALDGSLLSIRKFARVPISLERLIEIGSVPAQVAEVLKAVVGSRRNVLISGGTGSGKTTLLNAMSAFIDGRERIVTIEDSAELQLQQEHVVRLETRPAEHRGQGRSRPARPGQERAAHAARPDHPRRGSRRRGVRHAAGDEHRPRRVDDHGPRQHAARRPVARRADDRHERDRHSGASRRERRSPRPSMS